MTNAKSMVLGVLIVALASGCNKTEGEAAKPATNAASKAADKAKPAEKAPASKAAASEAPAAKAWLKLDTYGVQIEAPAGAKANAGAGTSLMIQPAEGACTIMLAKKDDMSFFESYDSAKKTIEKGIMGKMKAMITDEKTDADNWTLYYSKAGMIDPNETQFAVDVRSKVGDGVYSCGRVTDKQADAECVLAACKSIKPL